MFTQPNYTVVATGHSFFFRELFRCFLDSDANHIAKKYVLRNCAIVAFDLEQVSFKNESHPVHNMGTETDQIPLKYNNNNAIHSSMNSESNQDTTGVRNRFFYRIPEDSLIEVFSGDVNMYSETSFKIP